MPTPGDVLFQYAVTFVSFDDIRRWSPTDPGYKDYVREWTTILTTRSLPLEYSFDVSEVITLNRYWKEGFEPDTAAFWRYRILTNAVEIAMRACGTDDGQSMTPSYAAITSIHDGLKLDDKKLFGLLLSAFGELTAKLKSEQDEQALFLILAQILVRFTLRQSESEIASLAQMLIEDEPTYKLRTSTRFLWGTGFYDQFNALWRKYVEQLFPLQPHLQPIQLLRDLILNG